MTIAQPVSKLSDQKYRPDIDGLRAIAVLSVIGFHAFPNLVQGGFIGVDIFFVISGFLISSIVLEGLQSGDFRFADFYGRRIRRIFPALSLVLSSALGLGLFTMFADEYRLLGKHVMGGAGFFANFLLWRESGYFDIQAETKPLLHLWSLGIEEQFYIVWPFLLWLCWRWRFHPLILMILLALISFTLNIIGVKHDIVSTFYLPHTRFWELLVGASLAWFTLYSGDEPFLLKKETGGAPFKTFLTSSLRFNRSHLVAQLKSTAGAVLLILSLLIITQQSFFPGWWVVLPVLATALLISAGPAAWFNRVVLSNRGLVEIGLISFSLYLWHWLLLAFTRLAQGGKASLVQSTTVIFISFLLSWLTYRLVEQPLRFGKSLRLKTLLLLLTLSLLGGAGFYLTRSERAYSSYQEQTARYLASIVRSEHESSCFDLPYAFMRDDNWYCTFGKSKGTPDIFVYGDSHALSMLPAFKQYAEQFDRQIAFLASSGCPPLLGIQSWNESAWMKKHDCRETNEKIFRFVQKNHVKNVILVARWGYYVGGVTRPDQFNFISAEVEKNPSREISRKAFIDALDQTTARYSRLGVRVFWMVDNPQQRYAVRDVIKMAKSASDIEINRFAISRREHIADQAFVTQAIASYSPSQLRILNFDGILCNSSFCPFVLDGRSLYFDANHLSVFGATLLMPSLAQALFDNSL